MITILKLYSKNINGITLRYHECNKINFEKKSPVFPNILFTDKNVIEKDKRLVQVVEI